jgi:hypothetical protein
MSSQNPASSPKEEPTLVADIFHYSSYYWREFGQDESKDSPGDGNTPSGTLKYRAPSFGGSLDEYMNPKPVNNDRIKLKFYAHVLGDGSENIHFGNFF